MSDLMKPRLRIGAILLAVIALAAMMLALWMVFFWVPTERSMGVVQRIYYIHVPAAWTAFLAFFLVAICSGIYLWLRDDRLDAVALAAAELGAILTTVVLVTGPLWARLAWGAWWVWEPRLTLTLLLWFIYLGYLLVRGATENPEQGKRFAAVLGIVGAVNIPLIHMSVNWFRSLHPEAVVARADGPTAAPEIVQTVLTSFAALLLTFVAVLTVRYAVERVHRRALEIRAAAAYDSPVAHQR